MVALERILMRFERWEFFIFLSLVLLFLFPIWSLAYFPTLDGQGHVYNGMVLWELVFEDNVLFEKLFAVNHDLSPNWISQPFTAFLTTEFDAFICEKILLSIYVVGFCFAFRFMIFSVKPTLKLLSLLAFLFVYHQTMILGFLNYNYGLIFLLLSIGITLRLESNARVRNIIGLSLAVLCLYFSHLIAFFIFCVFIAAFVILLALHFILKRMSRRQFRQWILKLFCVFLIPISLLLVFLFNDDPSGSYIYKSRVEIWDMLFFLDGNSCVSEREWVYLRWCWIVLASCFGWIGIYAIVASLRGKEIKSPFNFDGRTMIFIVFFLLLIAACFIVPEASVGGGGGLTVRFVFMTTMIFIVCAFLVLRNRLMIAMALLVLVYTSIDRVFFLKRDYAKHQSYCSDIATAAKVIPQHSGILCIFDFSNEWVTAHAPKVFGTQSKSLLLDAWSQKKYSSVQWREPFRNDADLYCWEYQQWECSLELLEGKLQERVNWFVTIKADDSIEFSRPQHQHWKEFFEASCVKVFVGQSDIVIYRRKKD